MFRALLAAACLLLGGAERIVLAPEGLRFAFDVGEFQQGGGANIRRDFQSQEFFNRGARLVPLTQRKLALRLNQRDFVRARGVFVLVQIRTGRLGGFFPSVQILQAEHGAVPRPFRFARGGVFAGDD